MPGRFADKHLALVKSVGAMPKAQCIEKKPHNYLWQVEQIVAIGYTGHDYEVARLVHFAAEKCFNVILVLFHQ